MDQQPTQQPNSAPAAAPDAHYQMPQVNPGQTTGIIGLIFAFVGLAPAGLVLSIISSVKSSNAKASTVLGVVGIILNALALVLLGFFAIISIAAYSGIQERANDSRTQAYAASVRKAAEYFYADNGYYPQTVGELGAVPTNESGSSESINVVAPPITNTSQIGYQACGQQGASVQYLKQSSTVPVTLYLGTGSFGTC